MALMERRTPVAAARTYPMAGVYSFGRGLFERAALTSEDTAYAHLNQLREGDFVVSRLKAWEGAVVVVPRDLDGHFLSPEFPTYSLDPDIVLPSYWSIVCSRPWLWSLLATTSRGMGGRRERVHKVGILDLRMALPPLNQQHRIVNLIESVDSYIDSLQTQVEATRAARSALLSECLLNAGDHWQKTTLGEVAEVAVGPAFKSSVYRTCVDGVPLLRGINVGPDGLRWNETLYWPYHDTAPYEKYLLAANQTVVAMDATFTVQGDIRAGLVNESDLPLLLNQRVAAIAAGPSALSEYVFLLIGSDQFRRFLSRRQTGAFAPHIARRDLVDFPVALPPMNEQRRVADLIGSIDTQVASLDLQVEAVRAVRAAALSELLTGERLLDESYDAAVSL